MNAYKITKSVNWHYGEDIYTNANSHKEALSNVSKLETKRIFNPRFREIEQTGSYFFVEDMMKNGKTLIFEII